MIRRAEWRPRREDGRSERERRIVAVAALVASAATALAVGDPFDFLAAFGVGLLGTLLALRSRRPRRRERPSADLAGSAPWPLSSRTFPVSVAYYREFDLVGEDEAMVSFGDGWMTIEGLRASFSLRPGDAYVLHAGRNGCDLLLRRGERVEVRPYDGLEVAGEILATLRNRFEIALDLWHDGPSGEGAPVLPPEWDRVPAGDERTALAGLGGSALLAFAILVFRQGPPSQGWGLAGLFALGAALASLAKTVERVRRHIVYARRLPPSFR